jgi:proline racemase
VFHVTGQGTTLPGGTPAMKTTVGTKSWMMGIHQFVVDPSDPFPNGFIL